MHASYKLTSRLEPTLPKDHEDHIAGKGYNSVSHYNLVHNFSDASSEERMGEARKVASVAIQQSLEQKSGHTEGTKKDKRKVHCASMDGHSSSQKMRD